MRPIHTLDIMRYYGAYNDIEKNVLEGIHSESPTKRLVAFNQYANNYMKIGRNFKPKVGQMILQLMDNMFLNEGNIGVNALSTRLVTNELVCSTEKHIVKAVEVAASKILWLFDKQTIIMDSNNKFVLKATDYDDYTVKWKRLYNLKRNEIDEMMSLHFRNLDASVFEEWFKMRVFDQYLLSIYSEVKWAKRLNAQDKDA